MAKQSWWRRALGLDEKVENRAAGTTWQTIVIDGQSVDLPASVYRGAMGIPGAWRSANLIADLLGSVPWNAFRDRDGYSVKVEPTPHLLDQPAPPDTRMVTFSSFALDLIWHGNAVGIVAARNRDGYPTAVYPVPAEQVGVRRVTDNTYSPLPVGAIEYAIGPLRLGVDDVVHIKGPTQPGGLKGFGVLEAHMNGTLSLALEQSRQARNIANAGVPTGLLKSENPDLTEAEATALKAKWQANQRDRTVQVLNASTSFEPLAWDPEKMQLVEARKFALHEIALIFGLPLSYLGVEQSNRTYTNVEMESLNLLKFTLGGHLARFEQALSQQFPRGTWVKANLDSILRADTKSRYEAHQIGITSGFLTVDEVREIEDRPPLPEQPEPPAPVGNPTPDEESEDVDEAAA